MFSSSYKALLQEKFVSANPISFVNFMEMCLYNQEFGYYSQKNSHIGKDGDFITSVSIGSAFGEIIAERIIKVWGELNSPQSFSIIEMGANDGQLAIDISHWIEKKAPDFPLNYVIIEPLNTRQTIISQNIKNQQLDKKIFIHQDTHNIHQENALFLANELIDAFPVEIIKKNNNIWKKLHVQQLSSQHALSEIWLDLDSDKDQKIIDFINTLPENLPDGYQTEYRPNLITFVKSIKSLFDKGLVLLIDYGFPHSHYYHSARNKGTLQTYKNHTKTDNPLIYPGEQDISAHVDFTQLAKIFKQNGFCIHDFCSQQRYLTTHGAHWLKNYSFEKNKINQFKSLALQGTLGQNFYMLEITKNISLKSQPIANAVDLILEI